MPIERLHDPVQQPPDPQHARARIARALRVCGLRLWNIEFLGGLHFKVISPSAYGARLQVRYMFRNKPNAPVLSRIYIDELD